MKRRGRTSADPVGPRPGGPRSEYESRLQARQASAARVERVYNTLSNLRLLVFGCFLVSLWLVFGPPRWPLGWVLGPPALFLLLFIYHEIVAQRWERARRAVTYYEEALARLNDRWAGLGRMGEEFFDPRHPYAIDLDLFGPGSVFQRLCLARTRFGERALASWLLAPAGPEEIRERQEAVEELRTELDLRESLALQGEELERRGDPAAFLRWAEASAALPGTLVRVVVAILIVLNLVALVGAIALGWGWSPFVLCLALQIILRLRFQRRLTESTTDLEEAHGELQLLAVVLGSFESRDFHCHWLVRVREGLEGEGRPPSTWIRRLHRLFDVYEARRNSLFAPITFVFLLDFVVGFAFDDWRSRVGGKARDWLQAVGKLESISSLAGYAYERPEDVFPEVGVPAADPRAALPYVRAVGLGHALLPTARCVCNDVALGGSGDPRLLVVSGSNMSGKSTLLRSLGTAVVLAQCGAPVRAQSFAISPLRLGASIRVQDSIQEGVSHFYAEVKRLRQIVERTEESREAESMHAPARDPVAGASSADPAGGVLFLVDEILQGTNSHDRRIGVEAVMRTLVNRGAIGMITTHDLALTEMVARLDGRACNVHFEDQLEDGKMTFDYRLRAGVVEKSNALELMRSVGLDVDR